MKIDLKCIQIGHFTYVASTRYRAIATMKEIVLANFLVYFLNHVGLLDGYIVGAGCKYFETLNNVQI